MSLKCVRKSCGLVRFDTTESVSKGTAYRRHVIISRQPLIGGVASRRAPPIGRKAAAGAFAAITYFSAIAYRQGARPSSTRVRARAFRASPGDLDLFSSICGGGV